MAYSARQWQATNAKNQLVLGPPGKHAVLSAEDFGQVSTLQVPDPGRAAATFILSDSQFGSQTINGNLTVTGLVNATNVAIFDGNLDGDLVFSNAANRSIRFDAPKAAGAGATLSILGNDSSASTGGALIFASGASATSTSGAVTVASANSVASGAVTVSSGTSSSGNTGQVSLLTSNALGSSALSGGIRIETGSAPDTSGDIAVTTGAGKTTGDIELKVGIATGAGLAGRILLQSGSGNAGFAGPLQLLTGTAATGTGGTLSLDVGTGNGGTDNGTINIGNTGNVPKAINVGQATMTGATTVYAQRMPVVAVSSAKTITVGESGTLYAVTNTAGTYQILLPPAAAGLHYTFLLTTKSNGTVNIKSQGGAGTVRGLVICNNSTVPESKADNGNETIAQYTTAAVRSDRWDILCADGVTWMANGTSGAQGGVNFPTP